MVCERLPGLVTDTWTSHFLITYTLFLHSDCSLVHNKWQLLLSFLVNNVSHIVTLTQGVL